MLLCPKLGLLLWSIMVFERKQNQLDLEWVPLMKVLLIYPSASRAKGTKEQCHWEAQAKEARWGIVVQELKEVWSLCQKCGTEEAGSRECMLQSLSHPALRSLMLLIGQVRGEEAQLGLMQRMVFTLRGRKGWRMNGVGKGVLGTISTTVTWLESIADIWE